MDGHRHSVTSADGTEELTAVLAHKTLAVLDGQGHDAIDWAPELVVTQLAAFFS
jgi:pimeloyl-ACP methyl ester carboxylesterase